MAPCLESLESQETLGAPETATYEENLEAAYQASCKTSGLTKTSYET